MKALWMVIDNNKIKMLQDRVIAKTETHYDEQIKMMA